MQQPPNQPDWQQPQYYQQQPISPYTGQEYDPAWGTKVQPQAQPPRLPSWAILLFIAIFALVGAAVLYGASRSSIPTGSQVAATSTVDTTSTQPASSNGHFKVGDTATTPDGFVVTVLKTYTNEVGDQYGTPTTGSQYLVIDVSVKNATGKVQRMYEGHFTLIDSTGQHIDSTIALLSSVHYFTTSTLQDGATMRGQIVYEVPRGNHPYQYVFMGDVYGDTQTFWDIHS